MIKKIKTGGFTLIETIFTLAIGSALSIGLYIVFLSSISQINQDEVLNDLQSYASLSMEIISEKIRNENQVNILLGGSINILHTDLN